MRVASATVTVTGPPRKPRRSTQASAPPKPPQPSAPGTVRIIGGQWRRTRLVVARHPLLRPTPDRVRETLFNWLGQDLHGWQCLDAFAGSGALGLEAASRGAASVLLVEQDAQLARHLQTVCQRLAAHNARVRCADALAQLQAAAPASLHLVFLDAPFARAADLIAPALRATRRLLRPRGWAYLQAPELWDDARLQQCGCALRLHRHLKAGAVHAHLLHAAPAEEPPP